MMEFSKEDEESSPIIPPRVEYYEIRVRGHLDSQWSAWFDGLMVTPLENGETLLSGPILDQAALHGILIKVRNLSLPLLSVVRVEPGAE